MSTLRQRLDASSEAVEIAALGRINELEAGLRAVLDSDVGKQTLRKLSDGQGTATEYGQAWLRAVALLKP